MFLIGQTFLPLIKRKSHSKDQISGAMSTIVWCFVGIEAAVSMSRRAKQPRDVGLATIISFVIVLVLYISISIIPVGISTC